MVYKGAHTRTSLASESGWARVPMSQTRPCVECHEPDLGRLHIYPSLAPDSSSPRRTREPYLYVYGHLKEKKVFDMELNILAVDLGRCNTLVNSAVNLWVSIRKAANF
jgi:hypothetical protein